MYSDVFEGHHLDRIHKGTVQAKHPAKTNMFDLQKPKKAYIHTHNQYENTFENPLTVHAFVM